MGVMRSPSAVAVRPWGMDHLERACAHLAPALAKRFEPLLTIVDAKQQLGALREPLELLLHHLKVGHGVVEASTEGSISRLKELGAVPADIAPYLVLWWRLSCLGAHLAASQPTISWGRHLSSCRDAAGAALTWFGSAYPALGADRALRAAALDGINELLHLPLDRVEVPGVFALEERLERDGVVVLRGEPWTGKTSIAARLIACRIDQGSIPFVFHESSLVNGDTLPQELLGSRALEEGRRSLHVIAPALRSFVAARMVQGESFVVWLDDPFGHRRFREDHPLNLLPLGDWLDLSSNPAALGRLEIIVSTPGDFLERARAEVREAPLARANMALLSPESCVECTLQHHSGEALVRIVGNTAATMRCPWYQDLDTIGLIADYISEVHGTFLGLRTFCRLARHDDEDALVERLSKLAPLTDLAAEFGVLPGPQKHYLCAVLVGQALVPLYREYAFQSQLSFSDFCAFAGLDVSEAMTDSLSEWIDDDRISTLGLTDIPVFKHPELQAVVESWAAGAGVEVLAALIERLCGWEDENRFCLARWEAIHLSCRFAGSLSSAARGKITNEVFFAGKLAGLDVPNIIWAVVCNWSNISGTALARSAQGFLRRIPSQLAGYSRPLIAEMLERWSLLDPDARSVIVGMNGAEDGGGMMRPRWNEHHGLTFLACAVLNYSHIAAATKLGCPQSELVLDFVQSFIEMLGKRRTHRVFRSRVGDLVFETPGVTYSGEQVLTHLVDLATRRGVMDGANPVVAQVKRMLGE